MPQVLHDISNGVAIVTLNDPDKRNAFNLSMVEEVEAVFDEIESSDAAVVIVTGAGSAFCAGADLSQLGASQRDGLKRIYDGFLRVGRCPLPTIAAINGAAVGAGMNLALVCDVRLAAERARFDTRFLALGLTPGGGHSWMFQRVAGPQATAAALLLGEIWDGREAERTGLVHRCYPDADLLPAAQEIAERAALAPRDLIMNVKATMADVRLIDDHDEAVEREIGPQVDALNGPAFKERVAALQAKITSKS